MKVYQDLFTGDELLSDSYQLNEVFDGAGYEVESSMITKGAVNIDIGCGNEFGGGDEDGGVDDSSAEEKVIDIVDAFRYQQTGFSNKKEYLTYIKGFMQKVKKHLEDNNPDRVDVFMKGASAMVKHVASNFDDFNFYMGESNDPEANLVLAYYKEGALAPTFLYFVDALKEVKF
eukprot:GILJ01000124.1.p1 GENE.GILJ01000124.1~~GILJ01000124.1.p1  ORF type:complete len:174 (+),score=41.69 GILJ01000124.1:121-642(+)